MASRPFQTIHIGWAFDPRSVFHLSGNRRPNCRSPRFRTARGRLLSPPTAIGPPGRGRACAQGSGRYARGLGAALPRPPMGQGRGPAPERRPSAPSAPAGPARTAHAPEPVAGRYPREAPPRRNRTSGLRRRNTGRKGTAGRAQAPERQPCSLVRLPAVKPPSVLDPSPSQLAARACAADP
jgi:hypothetical protein